MTPAKRSTPARRARHGLVEAAVQDLGYGWRMLRRNPVFAWVAVASLALGIGANTAIFTLLNAVSWQRLPVADAGRLVQLRTVETATGRERGVPEPLFRELERSAAPFTGVAAVSDSDGVAFRSGDRAERALAEVVTGGYFSVLGVKPFLGRTFADGSDGAAWAPEVVLSFEFFRRRFGADPAVLGDTIHLNGYPFTIVGVSPPGFYGVEVGHTPELRVPAMREPGMQDRLMPALRILAVGRFLRPVARLQPGVTREQAQAAVESLARSVTAADADGRAEGHPAFRVRVLDGSRGNAAVAGLRRPLWIVLAVSGLVLLIACTNVAHLLLARATARRRELATRVALGASRGRLVRQLLAEGALLAGAGSALGLLLAGWGAAALRALLLPAGSVTPALELRADPRVLAFTASLSCLTVLLFGLAPALRASRADPNAALKHGNHDPAGRGRAGRVLVAAQVALALGLVSCAGLFVRSLRGLAAADPPDAGRVLMFSLKPVQDAGVRYRAGELQRLFPELLRRIESLPGVAEASLTSGKDSLAVPGVGRLQRTGPAVIEKEDQTTLAVDLQVAEGVSPAFFRMFGIAPLAGRTFTDSDDGRQVLVISEALARDIFGSENPLGRKIRLSWRRFAGKSWEIVGVVPEAAYASSETPRPRVCFFPFVQDGFDAISTLLVKTSLARPRALAAAVSQQVQALDRELPVFDLRTAAAEIGRERGKERLLAILSSLFGGLAALLAAIGLHALIAYAVASRTREIGIRIALGAGRGAVVRQVLVDALRLVVAGILAGLPLAWAAGRLVATQLHGVAAHDPPVLLGSALLMAGVGIGAGWLPARRAAAVDPMAALRAE